MKWVLLMAASACIILPVNCEWKALKGFMLLDYNLCLFRQKVLSSWQNRVFFLPCQPAGCLWGQCDFFSFHSCMLMAGWWLWYHLRKMGSQFQFMNQFHFSQNIQGKPQLFVGLHWHLDQVLTLFEENFGENVPVWRSGGKHQVAFLAKQ